MSRYRGNADTCASCGMAYGSFRTGLTWHDVRSWLWSPSPDHRDWRHVSRGTVLGKWHEFKRDLWERHVAECGEKDSGEVKFCRSQFVDDW